MKCKICGSECPPGAKICRDCAAARKRAFAATVTQPLLATAGVPSVSAPRFAPKPSNRPRPSSLLAVVHDASRPEAPQAALPLNVVPKSLGVHWLLIGVAIATTIVVLAVKILSSGSHPTDEDATAPVPAMTAPAMAAAPPVAPAPADAHPAPEASAPVKAGEVAVAKRVPEKASRKAATRTEAKPAAVPPPAPEPAPVARAPVPAPRPAEVPRADPWQAMNEGLSRCASEDLFSRGACEQRLRVQYCPNYWGLVPQCPIGPATDHGQ